MLSSTLLAPTLWVQPLLKARTHRQAGSEGILRLGLGQALHGD